MILYGHWQSTWHCSCHSYVEIWGVKDVAQNIIICADSAASKNVWESRPHMFIKVVPGCRDYNDSFFIFLIFFLKEHVMAMNKYYDPRKVLTSVEQKI